MRKLRGGERISQKTLESLQGVLVRIPDAGRLVHIQFRRFVGCPICHLHLRSFVSRHDELRAANVLEVAVFHSTAQSMTKYGADAPFPLIADPSRALYRAFGVEKSVMSILHPGAWGAALKGIVTVGPSLPPSGDTPWGLPAEFLIDPDGTIISCKYGVHAYDQWSVDEVLSAARQVSEPVAHLMPQSTS